MATATVLRQPTSPKFKDRIGQKFGRMEVVKFLGFNGKFTRWLLRCECGTEEEVFGTAFSRKKYRKSQCRACNGIHGNSKHDLFRTWMGMKARCSDAEHPGYGGRGIWVCDRWSKSFAAFCDDMGPKPSPLHSIDRKDNDSGYTCGKCDDCISRRATENCRWATQAEQMRNMRRNRKLTASNGETLLACEWCERLGISHQRLYQRLDKMPEHVAVSYVNGGTSPERQAWQQEMNLKHSEWKWRDRHLKKLASEYERLLRGESIKAEPKRLTHAERRQRRREIADMVRNGASFQKVSEHFGVGIHTVVNACNEFSETHR